MHRITYKSPFLILIIFFAFSCKKSESLQGLISEKAIDKEVTKQDFDELLKYVKSEIKYKKFTDPSELYNYIIKVVDLKKDHISVFNPVVDKPDALFNVDFFLENSKSMDGYVTGTDLKNSVYEVLENLKNVSKSLNLHYVNDQISYTVNSAGSQQNKDFILNLKPSTFVKYGGKRGVSDMAEVIETVLNQTKPNALTVLISDFVFSPGKGVDANSYLKIQKTSIKTTFHNKLTHQDLSVAVYQMSSSFDGDYYDHDNRTINFKGQRPFYIWFMGTSEQIQTLMKNQVIRKSDKQLRHSIVFKNATKMESIRFQIVKLGKVGNFAPTSKKEEIINAESNEDKFGFSIALDFKNNTRGEDYFSDSQNYKLSNDNYKLTARLLTDKEKERPDLKGFTHLLTLSTSQLINEDLELKIIARSPQWIEQSSSSDDSNIKNDLAEQNKTFGLSYLMEGVAEAFNIYGDNQQTFISTIKLVIKKK